MTDNEFESKAERLMEEASYSTYWHLCKPIALGLILIARCIHDSKKKDKIDHAPWRG